MSRLAVRYAKGLFVACKGKRFVPEEQLLLLLETYQGNVRLRHWLRVSRSIRVHEFLCNVKFHPLICNFGALLSTNNRWWLLPDIYSEYQKIVHPDHEHWQVKSAHPLPQNVKEEIKKHISQGNKKITMDFIIQTDLLSGMILSCGNYVIDASLKHQMQSLAKQLKEK